MKKNRSKKQGKLIANGIILEKHEMATVVFLLGLGYNIELIKPSTKYGTKSPDILINQLQWEIKSPEGNGKYTIQDTLRRASKQSPNIIVDLRRIKIHQIKCINEIKRQFNLSKNIHKILIITKQRQTIAISK